MIVPSVENKEELYGMTMGSQIKKFREILSRKKDMEVYEVFKNYIETKNMNIIFSKALQETGNMWISIINILMMQ